MKGKEMWAEQYTCDHGRQTCDPQERDSYVAGFEKALDMAADMMADFGNAGAAILIRAIGTAEVGADGKPKGWDE
jgi:hypothetical protein